jgi:cation-dependent mannose-6-phosphate receptor
MDCVYVFDIRTSRACATVPPPQASSSVSPLGVFVIIGGVALVVYFLAGCIYRRRVLHKVGWAQVPHIDSLSGIFSFIKVMILKHIVDNIGYDYDYFC